MQHKGINTFLVLRVKNDSKYYDLISNSKPIVKYILFLRWKNVLQALQKLSKIFKLVLFLAQL